MAACSELSPSAPSPNSLSSTVLEAHQSLIQADRENEPRFRELLEQLRREVAQHPPPLIPKAVGALRLASRCLTPENLGGDFFAISAPSPELLTILICDVMGHGPRASAGTTLLRGLVSQNPGVATNPGLMLSELNRALFEILKPSATPMFASAFYAVVNVADGRCSYANAGHPSPLRIEIPTETVTMLDREPKGPALGLFEAAKYPTRSCTLARGERLLLFTDGVYELDGVDGADFGQSRLREAVGELAGLSQERFLDELVADLKGFSVDGEFGDDACLLTLEFVDRRTTDDPARGLRPVVHG